MSRLNAQRFCSRPALLLAGFASLASFGCGSEFDSLAQVEGLRILAVQKSAPYARPRESVELEMLYHDASDKPRKIETIWISGCENPPGDLYSICFELMGPALRGELPGAQNGEAPAPPPADGDISADELLRLGVEGSVERVPVGPGFAFGFQRTFTLEVSKDVISSRPRPQDPKLPAYGLNYVFFAACAGELHLDLKAEGFPLRCEDSKGRPLGAEDFVVGYTAVYAYAKQVSENPRIVGFEVKGKKLSREEFCIGDECGIVEPDPDRECNASDPVVKACKDEDSDSCPKLEFKALIDPKSVEENGVFTATQGSPVKEQMWVNYHTDRGKFTSDVVLVNDTDTGFNPDTESEFVAPEEKGPAQVWAVVRDNRGGSEWARFQICIK